MGAALTYARRYGLFTLVGIAGEDDLDAPDLPAAIGLSSANSGSAASITHRLAWQQRQVQRRSRSSPWSPADGRLGAVRDELLVEVAAIASTELAAWAKRIIPIKNTLTAARREVEAALEVKLAQRGWLYRAAQTSTHAPTIRIRMPPASTAEVNPCRLGRRPLPRVNISASG